jgi:predicted enzyme related to lactoylglutathione lyase
MSDTATAPDTRATDATLNRFFWYELMTPDQEAAIDFYSHVVGWTVGDNPMTDEHGARYFTLEADGRGVGGVLRLSQEMRDHGARPTWLGYIHVADTDTAVASIKAAGGQVFMGPQDIPGVGRFAMVADPGGAPFYVMTPKSSGDGPPLAEMGATGQVGWHELYAGNGEKAAFDFYSHQFGWVTDTEMDMGAMGKYRIFSLDGVQLGGMMDKPENMPAPGWTFYVAVAGGIDDAAARIRDKGGQVTNGPMEVPGGSYIVQGIDPQGASFALLAERR